MNRKNPQKLNTGITGTTYNAYFYHLFLQLKSSS